MPLPLGCSYCGGDYWVLNPNWKVGGMQRCTCERGQALAALDEWRKMPPTVEVAPRITGESAALGVSMLAAMKFFPSEEGARLLIAEELRSMCGDDSQVLWIAKRMCRMFSEWPGLPSMRAVFWSKYVPLDRVAAQGEAQLFPEGIMPEIPDTRQRFKSLPAGSNDPEFDAGIKKLANLKRLN